MMMMVMAMRATGVSIAVRERERGSQKRAENHESSPGWARLVGPGWTRMGQDTSIIGYQDT